MKSQPHSEQYGDTAVAADSDDELAIADEKNAELAAELEQIHARLRKTAEELDFVRNQSVAEIEQHERYAVIPLLRDLLPVFDDLRREVDSTRRGGSAAPLIDGIEMILVELENALRRHEVLPIADIGRAFDPRLHESVGQIPSDQPKGTVIRVLQPGRTIHDRVVCPARVIISGGVCS